MNGTFWVELRDRVLFKGGYSKKDPILFDTIPRYWVTGMNGTFFSGIEFYLKGGRGKRWVSAQDNKKMNPSRLF